MRKFLILAMFFVFNIQWGNTQDVDAVIKDANIFSKSGKITKAIEKFESLGHHGSADIYYNLGRLYQENGDIARAALNYERALKIEYRHPEASNNLSIIREETDFDIIPVEEMFLIRWWKAIARLMSTNVWMIFSLIIALAMIASLYYWWIADKPQWKKKAFITTIATPMLLLVVLALGATSKSLANNKDFAVIMNGAYDMHEGADDRSPIVKDVEAGTKVQVVDKIDEWIKVVTADTESGWLKSTEVEFI